MGEPSYLHGVPHTNAGCLGSDQGQKGSVLGSTIGSSTYQSLCLQHCSKSRSYDWLLLSILPGPDWEEGCCAGQDGGLQS